MPPQALGELMLVPFINCFALRVHSGTGAIAPPGALMSTPRSPSKVGPRELQVYCRPPQASGSMTLCDSAAMSGDTQAPMPMIGLELPPGAPTVERPGPLLPAEEMK